VRQRLLFESGYVALARRWPSPRGNNQQCPRRFFRRERHGLREPKEPAAPSSRGRCASAAFPRASDDRGVLGLVATYRGLWVFHGCGPNRDSIASAQASEARHQSVQARAFRCRAGTDVVAKDVEGGGRKRQSVTAAAQQMILFILSKTGSRGDRVGQRCAVKSAVGLVSTQPSTRSKNL
jgi:hypothetical protein